MVEWKIKKIINFTAEKHWGEGYAQFGFHDLEGNQYVLNNEQDWIGLLGYDNLVWTMGANRVTNKCKHYNLDLKGPKYLEGAKDESILFSDDKRIYRFYPKSEKIDVVVDSDKYEIKDIGNCIYDSEENIWINEITGCKVWQFDYDGNMIRTLGNGQPGFQKCDMGFDEVSFNWIFDMKCGPDGNIYVLDSGNYTVRMIDIKRHVVKLVAGTGEGGYIGDDGHPLEATFGTKKDADFDGPWSMVIDEKGNIYIGDTQNHVVRMIDSETKKITTIAGNQGSIEGKRNSIDEKDPFKLNLPLICSMDYYDGKLYIPEWDGDLIVLEKLD
ncbi:hypothetical protein R9X47_22965 [Wukongibacter baidiensis]|uniref:hypothetical protein n=1 Tax=Wukongibacter baidiensis TaxID=1723361 RepID=UPI003D7F3E9A